MKKVTMLAFIVGISLCIILPRDQPIFDGKCQRASIPYTAMAEKAWARSGQVRKSAVHQSEDHPAPVVQIGHRADVRGVMFSEDERILVSWDVNGIVKVWNLDELRLLATWKMPVKYVQPCGMVGQDRLIAFDCSHRYNIDLLTGDVSNRQSRRDPANALTRIDPYVTPFVLTGELSDGSWEMALYNLFQEKETKRFTFILPNDAQRDSIQFIIDPAGQYMAVFWPRKENESQLEIAVYGIRGRAPLKVFQRRIDLPGYKAGNTLPSITVSPTGSHLGLTDDPGYRLVSAHDALEFIMPKNRFIYNLAPLEFNVSGAYLVARDGLYGPTEVRRVTDGKIVLSQEEYRKVWVSPSGRWIVSSHGIEGGSWIRYTEHRLRLHNLELDTTEDLHPEASWILDMAISANGQFLAVIEETSAPRPSAIRRTVSLYDLKNGRLLWQLSGVPRGIEMPSDDEKEYGYWISKYRFCVLNADGSRLMVQSSNGSVFVWRTGDLKLIYENIRKRTFGWRGWALDQSGSRLAYTGDPSSNFDINRMVGIIDIDTGGGLCKFGESPGGEFYHVCFSPDGKFLAAVSDNHTDMALVGIAKAKLDIKYEKIVSVWHIASGNLVKRIHDGRNDGVFPLAFSEDSRKTRCGPRVFSLDNPVTGKHRPAGYPWQGKKLPHFWIHSASGAAYPGSPLVAQVMETGDGIDMYASSSRQWQYTLYAFPQGLAIVDANGGIRGDNLREDLIHAVAGIEVYPLITDDKETITWDELP